LQTASRQLQPLTGAGQGYKGAGWNEEVLPSIWNLRRRLIAGDVALEAPGSGSTTRGQDVPA